MRRRGRGGVGLFVVQLRRACFAKLAQLEALAELCDRRLFVRRIIVWEDQVTRRRRFGVTFVVRLHFFAARGA